MPTVLTHKYLKANSIVDNAVLPGSASNVVEMYWDFLPDAGDLFTLSFANGSAEVFVGDLITASGGATALVAAVNHTSGTWAGGDEVGSLEIKELTAFIALSETGTSDSGGAIGLFTFLDINSLRDTSETNCSVPNVRLDDYVAGESIEHDDAALLSPTNPIPWNESALSEHYDSIFMVVSKSTNAAWQARLGAAVSTLGRIDIVASLDSINVVDTAGTHTLSLPAGSIPHDGNSHVIAAVLRREANTVPNQLSCEIDGVEVGTPIALGGAGAHIQLTNENLISFTTCKAAGVLACRFKDGLPSNYQEIIAEMAANWGAGKKGISPSLTGIR